MMRQTTLRLAAILVLAMLLLSACAGGGPTQTPAQPSQTSQPAATSTGPAQPATGGPKKGGTLTAAVDGEPPTLDWATSTTMAARQVGYHVFEQLLTFNDKYEVIPQLADSYTVSPDGKVYTIKLRQGVKFHNGKEMKAEDVKASVDRFMEINPRKGDVAAFKEIRVKDDFTVELELKEAQGAFLSTFAMPIPGAPIMPKEAITGVPAGKLRNEQLIGTGPFKLAEWVPASHVKLVKFDQYQPDTRFPGPMGLGGKREAFVNEVILKAVKEPSARMAGLEAGDFDFADALPPSEYERVKKDGKLVPQILAPQWWITLVFNVTKPPFDNVKLRKAVAAALDQEAVMLAVAERPEFYRLDGSLYFKEQVWHNDVGGKLGLYNVKKADLAKQLVAEAGYKGEKIRVITNTNYDWMYKASVVTAEQLKKIGLNVELIVVDWPTAQKTRENFAAWELYYTGQSPRFDPSGFGYMLHSGKANISGYSNPKMDQLLQAGLREGDVQKRQQIYEDVARLWYEDMPQIKHGDYHGLQGHQAYLKGYQPWYSVRFWNVYLDK